MAGRVIGGNDSYAPPTACETRILNPPRDQCAIRRFGIYGTHPPADHNDIAVNFRNSEGMLNVRSALAEGTVYTALS